MILCDIGNSSLHFLIDGKEYKYFFEDLLPKINETIYYISVSDEGLNKLKMSYSNIIDLEPFIIFSTTYKGMGLDRKVASIGFDNAVIIDAGSAITVDIIEDNLHKGGFIYPGLKASLHSYNLISSKLKQDLNLKVNLDTIPLNTQDAISYAILKSVILPIKEISNNKRIIITGGDAKVLASFFENCEYRPKLIFDNMKGIISANNSFTKRKNSKRDS